MLADEERVRNETGCGKDEDADVEQTKKTMKNANAKRYSPGAGRCCGGFEDCSGLTTTIVWTRMMSGESHIVRRLMRRAGARERPKRRWRNRIGEYVREKGLNDGDPKDAGRLEAEDTIHSLA